MKRPSWVWLIWLIPAIVLGVGLVLPAGIIVLHTCQGNRAVEEISVAFRESYPEFKLNGGVSYTKPTLGLSVYGVTDKAKQQEITRWLTEFKAEHRIGPEINLRFGDKAWDDPEAVLIK